MPECRTIFVLPPSRAALEQRLRGRGTDSDEVIARRLRDSIADMSHWNEFDYVVVNDDFERATADLEAIVAGRGEHLRATDPNCKRCSRAAGLATANVRSRIGCAELARCVTDKVRDAASIAASQRNTP